MDSDNYPVELPAWNPVRMQAENRPEYLQTINRHVSSCERAAGRRKGLRPAEAYLDSATAAALERLKMAEQKDSELSPKQAELDAQLTTVRSERRRLESTIQNSPALGAVYEDPLARLKQVEARLQKEADQVEQARKKAGRLAAREAVRKALAELSRTCLQQRRELLRQAQEACATADAVMLVGREYGLELPAGQITAWLGLPHQTQGGSFRLTEKPSWFDRWNDDSSGGPQAA